MTDDSQRFETLTDRKGEALVVLVAALVNRDHDSLGVAGAFTDRQLESCQACVEPTARLRAVAESLIVVLPGGGYGPLGSALRFPILACRQISDGETIEVVYPETRDDDPIPTRIEMLTTAVSQQVLVAMERSTAADVVVVAKSLGTRALAAIAPTLPRERRISAIWLTPLFGVEDVRIAAMRTGLRSLIVAGTADEYHDQNGFDAVSAALSAKTLLIPGADHSLEVHGDVFATVDAMRALSEAVLDFAR